MLIKYRHPPSAFLDFLIYRYSHKKGMVCAIPKLYVYAAASTAASTSASLYAGHS